MEKSEFHSALLRLAYLKPNSPTAKKLLRAVEHVYQTSFKMWEFENFYKTKTSKKHLSKAVKAARALSEFIQKYAKRDLDSFINAEYSYLGSLEDDATSHVSLIIELYLEGLVKFQELEIRKLGRPRAIVYQNLRKHLCEVFYAFNQCSGNRKSTDTREDLTESEVVEQMLKFVNLCLEHSNYPRVRGRKLNSLNKEKNRFFREISNIHESLKKQGKAKLREKITFEIAPKKHSVTLSPLPDKNKSK